MTSRERVLTALRRREPDRAPATLYDEVIGYVPDVARMFHEKCGGQWPGDYFGCDVRSVAIGPTRLTTDFSKYIRAQENVRVDEWGVGWRAGGFHHYAEIIHPLQSLDARAIRDYPCPDLDAAYRYEGMKSKVAALHERGLAVTGYPGSVFEQAWQMRGMAELFVDILDRVDTAEFLLDQIAGRVAGAAQRLAAADVDVLILGDDIATQRGLMMSLAMWSTFFKPRLQRIIRAAREVKPDLIIFYHSDGNVWDAIAELIDAGVEVLNPVQPECMDPAEVKRVFGDRLAFFGAVSLQRTLPFGAPDDVRAEVKRRIETVGKGGGLLLSPTHCLQPDVPWENVVAFFEAVEEYGACTWTGDLSHP
jgi:uroporphyrinogen decarboxylase